MGEDHYFRNDNGSTVASLSRDVRLTREPPARFFEIINNATQCNTSQQQSRTNYSAFFINIVINYTLIIHIYELDKRAVYYYRIITVL